MKHLACLLSALVLVVSMQGCDEVMEPETPNNPVQLHLKSNISAIAPAISVNDSDFKASNKIGVYVSATGELASTGNILNNEPFTFSSGNLNASEGKEVYWDSPESKLSIWAYYPYAESVSSNSAYPFAVATDQSEVADYYNSDFITAQATNLAPRTHAVDINFRHALSKIIITLENGTGITIEELDAAEKRLSINGVIVDGTIDFTDGTATIGTTEATITPYAFDGLNYAAIVYPQQSEITFRIELGDDVYTYSTEVDYTAGKQYRYTFVIDNLNPQGITLSSSIISDWIIDKNPAEERIIAFADPKFKEYLLQETYYTLEWDSKIYEFKEHAIQGSRVDINGDGEISIAEAKEVSALIMRGLGITDLSGIEYFVNLKFLLCTNAIMGDGQYTYLDGLTSIDVSKNTKLRSLICSLNHLAELDVSKNTELIQLSCSYNNLSSLDLTNNTLLESFDCWTNELSSLDVSKNTKLAELQCGNNRLSEIDLSSNTLLTWLDCSLNQLANLDVSKNTALNIMYGHNNQLTTLDVSKNTALTLLRCQDNKLTSLDVSKNTSLNALHCSPMNDEEGNNLLEKLYLAEGQSITILEKPEATVIEYK